MEGEAYMIKPLEWWREYNGYEWYADTMFGPLTVRKNGAGLFNLNPAKWMPDGEFCLNYDTSEEAKREGCRRYLMKLLEALEPIPPAKGAL